jgi:hypothetical protein
MDTYRRFRSACRDRCPSLVGASTLAPLAEVGAVGGRAQTDGSLPALPDLHLAAKSTLIDKGTSVGLPYNGPAPDLGAFETGATPTSAPPTTTPPTTPGGTGCTATYQLAGSWSGGFQGGVTVTNSGSSTVNGATATFGFLANGDGAAPPTTVSCTAS